MLASWLVPRSGAWEATYGDEGSQLIVKMLYRSQLSFRWSFNITLLITAVSATAAGGSPNYIVLSSLAAFWSVGVGGNLPVDSAVFLGMS